MGNSRLIVDQATYFRELGHDVHYLYVHDISIKEKSSEININAFPEMINFWGANNLHFIKINKIKKLFMSLRNKFKFIFNRGYVSCDDLYSNKIHKEINKLDKINKFDVCIVNYYYLSKALLNINIPIKALLTHDAFCFRDLITGTKVMGSLLPNEEAKAAQRADYILNVQEEDTSYFKKISPKSTVLTIFTNLKFKKTEFVGNHNILFLSGINDFNLNGIKWFIKNVFPLILEKFPDSKLIIGGGICKLLETYQHPNIQLMGFVENLQEFFNKGDVFINPTFQGTGLKIKTFEGIANGKIVIAHPHSMTGIFEPSISPIIIAENAKDWFRQIEKIFSDETMAKSIKSKDEEYVIRMKKYIDNQYTMLLNNKKCE